MQRKVGVSSEVGVATYELKRRLIQHSVYTLSVSKSEYSAGLLLEEFVAAEAMKRDGSCKHIRTSRRAWLSLSCEYCSQLGTRSHHSADILDTPFCQLLRRYLCCRAEHPRCKHQPKSRMVVNDSRAVDENYHVQAVSTIDNTSPKTRVFELLRSRNVRVLLVLGLRESPTTLLDFELRCPDFHLTVSRLVTISWETLFSLFASTPSPSGLGLHPFTIGLILSAGGIVTIIAYLCLFPLMFGKLGYQWMLRMGFVMAVVAALGYPVMQGTVAEQRGMEGQLQGWTVMVLVPAMAAKKLSELFIV